nr:M9 family metallopeptidase [Kitasatospora cheerisanensis]
MSLLLSLCLALGFLAAFVPGARAAAAPAGDRSAKPAKASKSAPRSSAESERRKDSDREVRADASKSPPLLSGGEPAAPAAKSLAAAAACNIADFTGKTGSALVTQIKSASSECVNTLFQLKGNDAKLAFNESQMVTVANALRDVSANYPGDNSTSALQIVLYLRAGYYVQWYNPDVVGTYGSSLKTAIEGGLDRFFASSHSQDVSDVNGLTLGEAVTLIDSAAENARYLSVVKRLLNAYDSSYDSNWNMRNAVNAVYTVLWRGHQNSDFLPAVQADPSVLDALQAFATRNNALLGGDSDFIVVNSGRELGRFLQYPAMQAKVRPLVKSLLDQSSITGRTATMWAVSAEMTDAYDKANCAFYGTCDLPSRLKAAVLTVNYTCSPSIKIIAQALTADQLNTACTSLKGQDAFFHGVTRDKGAVANDNNSTIEVVVFHSSNDYKLYAGTIYDISTDNGGMYLEGKPDAAGNQPRFIAHEAEWLRPDFQIWNLNHEYTHYLDGRFDMYGDFDAGMTTPTVWWVEGFAEYISYAYRGVEYTDAIAEAGKHTYALSTLFDTTYDNADQTRVYNWGYLAVRYMLQSHRADMDAVLAKYRAGDWNGARTILKTTIGTRYDADFNAWLTACNGGNCGAPTVPTLPECTGADTRQLGQNCGRSNLAATVQNYQYFYLWVPAGTTSLTITATGGTGNADLYYNGSNWATTGSYNAKSTNSGNSETLTISNPPAGYNYISLYAQQGFDGASVSTSF